MPIVHECQCDSCGVREPIQSEPWIGPMPSIPLGWFGLWSNPAIRAQVTLCSPGCIESYGLRLLNERTPPPQDREYTRAAPQRVNPPTEADVLAERSMLQSLRSQREGYAKAHA